MLVKKLVKISRILRANTFVAYKKVEICDGVFGSLFNNNSLLILIDNKILFSEENGEDILSFTSQKI